MDAEKRQELIELIKQAFRYTPMPKTSGLETDILRKKHWKNVSTVMVRHCGDSFASFSFEGFRFYVPAIMVAIIAHPDEADVAVNNIIPKLAPPTIKTVVVAEYIDDLKRNFLKQHQLFTDKEKEAIVAFLNAYKDLNPFDMWTTNSTQADMLERAIEFWNNPTTELD